MTMIEFMETTPIHETPKGSRRHPFASQMMQPPSGNRAEEGEAASRPSQENQRSRETMEQSTSPEREAYEKTQEKLNREIRSQKIESALGILLIREIMNNPERYKNRPPKDIYQTAMHHTYAAFESAIENIYPDISETEKSTLIMNVFASILKDLGAHAFDQEAFNDAERVFHTRLHNAGKVIEEPTKTDQISGESPYASEASFPQEDVELPQVSEGGIIDLKALHGKSQTEEITEEDTLPHSTVDPDIDKEVEQAFGRITIGGKKTETKDDDQIAA